MKNKKKSQGYTQDILPFKDITYGMIVTKDNQYVKVLEIEPVNFDLKTVAEQNAILDRFYQWIKVSPVQFQLSYTTQTTDTMEMIDNLYHSLQLETNEKIKRQIEEHIQFVREEGSAGSFSKRYYLSFKYEGNDTGEMDESIYDIAVQMDATARQIAGFMRNMGNYVVRHEDENRFLANLLYKYLNKKTSRAIPLDKRIEKAESDAVKTQGTDSPVVSVLDIIAPRGIERDNPKYWVVDGKYFTFLYIKRDGYPINVLGSWSGILTNYGMDVEVTMHFRKKNMSLFTGSLSKSRHMQTIALRGDLRNEEHAEDVERSYNNTRFVQSMIKDRQEEMYDACFLITIADDSAQELVRKRAKIERDLRSNQIITGDSFARNEDCFMTYLPLAKPAPSIFKKSKRNFLTSSICSCYPFTSLEVCDQKGIMFGINRITGSFVALDPFNTERFNNANMVIFGASGSGKTFMEQLVARRMLLSGAKCMFVLPLKPFEYKRGCEAYDGQYIELFPESKTCINLFEIRSQEAADKRFIEDDVRTGGSLRSKKLTTIKTFLGLLFDTYNPITPDEMAELDACIVTMYERFGITEDNDSIYNPDGSKKIMPTFSDFDAEIRKVPSLTRIVSVIKPFVHGSCKNLNGQTNVNLDNRYICFDVNKENIPDELLPPFFFLATDLCYDTLKASRLEKSILFLDEVWYLMKNRSSAKYVEEMPKIVRGYGSSVVMSTQDIMDFYSESNKESAKKIFNNSELKAILKTKTEAIPALAEAFGLNREECRQIEYAERGEGLMFVHNDNIPIAFVPSAQEYRMFTTDPNDLRRMQGII